MYGNYFPMMNISAPRAYLQQEPQAEEYVREQPRAERALTLPPAQEFAKGTSAFLPNSSLRKGGNKENWPFDVRGKTEKD